MHTVGNNMPNLGDFVTITAEMGTVMWEGKVIDIEIALNVNESSSLLVEGKRHHLSADEFVRTGSFFVNELAYCTIVNHTEMNLLEVTIDMLAQI